MKALFLILILMTVTLPQKSRASVASGQERPKIVVLGVLAREPRAEYEARLQTFFKDQWRSCSACDVKNLTPYNEQGELDRAALPSAIEKIPGQVQVLYLAWNEVADAGNQKILEALKKLAASGVLLIGPAGEPSGDGPSHSLSRTILGQTPEALIIGELNEKESLARRSFYGPEMLTAIKPPKDVGLGWAPPFFAARLTREYGRKSHAEWMSHLRTRKSLSRRLWPGMDEFFGR